MMNDLIEESDGDGLNLELNIGDMPLLPDVQGNIDDGVPELEPLPMEEEGEQEEEDSNANVELATANMAQLQQGSAPLDEEDDDYDVFRNVGLGLTGHYKEIMVQYWQELINEIESTNEPGSNHEDDFKSNSLPFARIRKVMKTDEDVRMISAEVPIIFAKACEIFITELTMRAWCVAENNRRRTLQKADIAEALKKCDMYDFLIDIVPRSETNQHQ